MKGKCKTGFSITRPELKKIILCTQRNYESGDKQGELLECIVEGNRVDKVEGDGEGDGGDVDD